jgi:methanogenic corrinoid protein MtbC1
MAKIDVDFDPAAFRQTASLFVAKREHLGVDAIEGLAREIVERLASAALASERPAPAEIDPTDLLAFCAVLLEPTSDAALSFITQRREQGLARQDVYLGYVNGAAKWLGEQWDEDRLSSFQVTVATGHLYALLRSMRSDRSLSVPVADNPRTALFATVPGENHGLGITVAADLFRDAGWDIDLQVGCDHETLLAHVEQSKPFAIGLSLSTDQRIDALIRLVVAIRLTAPHTILGVAPPEALHEEALRGLVDIDLVFRDAASACTDLERTMKLRSRRNGA